MRGGSAALEVMRNRYLLPLAPLVATLPACFQFDVEAQAGYAQLALDGDLGYANGTNPQAAVRQDIGSALGLGDDQGSPFVRAKIDTGVPVLSVSAFQFRDEGTGTLSAPFGDVTPIAPVRSEFDLLDVKAAYAFEIPIGPVSLSPGVAVEYVDLDIRVRDLIGIASERVELQAPLPMLFLRGEVEVGPVGAVAEVAYAGASVDGVDASLLDVEALLLVHPTSMLELFVGYRYLQLQVDGEIDGDSYDSDLRLGGLMVGGGVRF